ncbi:MAG: hypothetical protein D4R76_08275 [Methylococcus sp.]|nr:MAG: hypothetical protein D4R76_08275 [Methylococcus sp.]
MKDSFSIKPSSMDDLHHSLKANTLAPMSRIKSYLHNRPKLDFLIVGAEKAGTTALFAYLRQIPGVYIPINKELNFFDRDHRYGDGKDFSPLHRWFLLAPKGALLGEATPTYLMNPHCFSRIYDYNPDIKVVALLRSPVRRAYSAWNYRRARLRDKRDFMTAVKVEVESGADITVARENKYRYIGAGRYADQIRALRAALPEENILLIKYEEFTRDQLAQVKAVSRFIGGPVDPDVPAIKSVNTWAYRRAMTREEFDTVLAYYQDEITDIEGLTGWDLSDWRQFERPPKKRSI